MSSHQGNVAALTWIDLNQLKTAGWETLPGRGEAHSKILEVTKETCLPRGMYGICHNLVKQSLGEEQNWSQEVHSEMAKK